MPFQSSQDLATQAAKQLTNALLHPQPAGPFCQVGEKQSPRVRYHRIKLLHRPPQGEIADRDTPPKVQITVPPLRVPNTATHMRVVQPIVTHISTTNSHEQLNPTPRRAVTPSTP
jgi:hypothetical protein